MAFFQVCLFSFSHSAFHQFLSTLHDKIGAKTLVLEKKHFVIFYVMNRKCEVLQPQLSLGNLSLCHFLDQTDKRHFKKQIEIRARIHQIQYNI